MFPFFPPPQNQSQSPNDFAHQQFRPNMQIPVNSQNPHLNHSMQPGFDPKTAQLMMLNGPPSAPMMWPVQMNNVGVQLAMQMYLQQQQQFPSFNPVIAGPFPQNLNSMKGNMHLQNGSQTINQVMGLQQQQQKQQFPSFNPAVAMPSHQNSNPMNQQSAGQSVNRGVGQQQQQENQQGFPDGNLVAAAPFAEDSNPMNSQSAGKALNHVVGPQQQQQNQQQFPNRTTVVAAPFSQNLKPMKGDMHLKNGGQTVNQVADPQQRQQQQQQRQEQEFPSFKSVVAVPFPQNSNSMNGNMHPHNAFQSSNQVAGLQQQQFPSFNSVVATPFSQNLFPMNPQNVGQVVNQMVGLQQGPLYAQNAMIPVNNAVLQQCFQNLLGGNQIAAINNAVANPFVATGSTGFGGGLLPADGVEIQNVDQKNVSKPMVNSVNCWNARPEMAVTSQSQWLPGVPNMQQVLQAQNNLVSSGVLAPQENRTHTSGNGVPQLNLVNSSNVNFKANPDRSFKRDQSQSRFQKAQPYSMTNNKNFRQFSGNRGAYNGRQRHSHPAKSHRDKPSHANFHEDKSAPRRSLSLTYTEKEIQQWREARRRNYPTKTKISKESSGGGRANEIDAEAKMRRQQLKEVLAKQAELGVEVAEIPPNYLSESENRSHERDSRRRPRGKRRKFQNKFNEQGSGGQEHRHPKRQKPNKPASNLTPIKRPATLLQKLLSTEIRRDKIYLLQAFRFMTLNSFFDDWPEKPLVTPHVTAKDTGDGTAECLPSAGIDLPVEVKRDSIINDLDGDVVVEEGEVEGNGALESNSESGDEEDDDCDDLEEKEPGEISE